ncbi:ABC transporter substrate-binding protein [Flavonifractor plautii]|nr:ABC transporter substrate-binding protein [Flavonifractor plautii]
MAPDSGAAYEKLVYSNGGPEEFFETPWLNPGTYVYNKAVYGHLIVADENLNPIPNHPDALATYEYSADGKTLTFTLRDDAYWHNGEKVTPEDIKWSIEFVAKTPVANAVFISTFSAIAARPATLSMTPSAVSLSTGRRSSLPLIRSPPTLC